MNRFLRLSLLMIAVASVAVAQTSQPSQASQPDAKPGQPSQRKEDKAAAYYHYTLAHMYEEMVTAYGRSDLASKATEEYRLAIDADPSSEFLTSALAELYVKTGRIADAVREAHEGHRPILDVRQQQRRDARVVVEDLTLGEPAARVEHLVQVRQRELPLAHPYRDPAPRNHAATLPPHHAKRCPNDRPGPGSLDLYWAA